MSIKRNPPNYQIDHQMAVIIWKFLFESSYFPKVKLVSQSQFKTKIKPQMTAADHSTMTTKSANDHPRGEPAFLTPAQNRTLSWRARRRFFTYLLRRSMMSFYSKISYPAKPIVSKTFSARVVFNLRNCKRIGQGKCTLIEGFAYNNSLKILLASLLVELL